jgi:uncharacterized protein YbcI
VSAVSDNSPSKEDKTFLKQRIERAQKLQNGLEQILGNPLVKLLTGIKN